MLTVMGENLEACQWFYVEPGSSPPTPPRNPLQVV